LSLYSGSMHFPSENVNYLSTVQSCCIAALVTQGSCTTAKTIQLKIVFGWLLHCKRFLEVFAVNSRVFGLFYVSALPPLALMSTASEVPIGLSTSMGRCHSRSVLAFG
jgi:hypothetical protein